VLAARLDREPTVEEIAQEARVPVRRVPRLLAMPPDALSLDGTATREGDARLGYPLADETAPDPEREVVRDAEWAALRALLERLPERERRVLRRRMGFEDGRIWTLQEIAEQLQVSRESVRRIELSALRRLRAVAPPWVAV
jgi:RNA polymerase sigma factor (sigma-70 family)